MVSAFDWHPALINMLINAGINGIKQRDITFHFKTAATAAELTEELELLREQGKVQKFTVKLKHGGRPSTVWRATVKILED